MHINRKKNMTECILSYHIVHPIHWICVSYVHDVDRIISNHNFHAYQQGKKYAWPSKSMNISKGKTIPGTSVQSPLESRYQFPHPRVCGGEGALAQSCRAPHGHDQSRGLSRISKKIVSPSARNLKWQNLTCDGKGKRDDSKLTKKKWK